MSNLVILVLLFSGLFNFFCECTCKSVSADETTHLGGSESVIKKEAKVFKSIKGKILDVNDEPVPDVLVEIFDQPEWITKGLEKSDVKQNRLKACKTGKDGSFCFSELPAGKYEILASKDVRFNPTHVYIVVNPDDKEATEESVEVLLTLGN
jgi:hypothetical protein